MFRQWALIVVCLALLIIPPVLRQPDADGGRRNPAPPADPTPQKPAPPPVVRDFDRALRGGDTDAVLSCFRANTLTDAERKTTQDLIAGLRADSFAAREQAEDDLVVRGPRVVALVRRAGRGAEPEQAARVARCVERCLEVHQDDVVLSAVRLIGNRRPADAAPVLLDYAPYAPTPAIAAEVQSVLAALAASDAKTHDVFVKALTDSVPEKRAIAGLCLLQPSAKQHRAAVRKLLEDPDIFVRVELAKAFVDRGEKDPIPTLIDALAGLPEADAWTVLDRLYDLAGADGPVTPLGSDASGRMNCRNAWSAWWRAHRAKLVVQPSADKSRDSGVFLVVAADNRDQSGSVALVDRERKEIWQIRNLSYPMHAQVVAIDHVLVAEYGDNLVTERSLTGETLWKKELGKPPVAAQRLADGKTFIACHNELLVVDAAGKTSFSRKLPRRDISTAVARPNGEYVVITQAGAIVRLDATGKEIGRFDAGGTLVLAAGVDVTANGRILVPLIEKNRVVEFAPGGTVLWQTVVAGPVSVQRLADGHTLVACAETSELVEFDRMGNIVWRGQMADRPVFVRRLPDTVKPDAGQTGKPQ